MSPSRSSRARLAPLLLALLLAAPLAGHFAAPTRADSATAVATLPPVQYSSAVWDGSAFYVFGGQDCPNGAACSLRGEIVRFAPGGDPTVVASLPAPRHSPAAVFGDGHAYVFGGWRNGPGASVDIVQFTPPSTVALLSDQLPEGILSHSAVWDDARGVAYVFGGYRNGTAGATAAIVRFDPAAPAGSRVTTLPDALPSARRGTSAVWDDGADVAYVFGGETTTGFLDEIVKFDPAAPAGARVAVLGASDAAFRLPTPLTASAAAWDPAADVAYLFGGYPPSYKATVERFDPTPAAGAAPVTTMSASLPWGRSGASAAWGTGSAHVFGGYDGFRSLDQVVRYSLEPGAPQSFSGSATTTDATLTLTWQKPLPNTHTRPVSGYEVFRSATPTGFFGYVDFTPGFTWSETVLPGETWCYKVRAVSTEGRGAFAGPVCLTAPTVPTAPRDLTATSGVNAVTLTWTRPESDGGSPLEHYRVLRATSPGGSFATLVLVPAAPDTPQKVFDDTSCPVGATCRYLVAAINGMGEGPLSKEASASGTAATYLSQSFDSGAAPGWSLGGLWHVGSCASVTPLYSLSYNNPGCPATYDHPTIVGGEAVSPASHPVPAGTSAILTWASRHDADVPGGDVLGVDVSVDGGATWCRVHVEQGAVGVWQNRAVRLDALSLPPSCWRGLSQNVVEVRFSFTETNPRSNFGEGWYVDEVHLLPG